MREAPCIMIIRPTSEGVHILAPAKLNLFLEVEGKRSDGYHELTTLMVTVDWHDELQFEQTAGDAIVFTCDHPTLPLDADNLVVRAANLLRHATSTAQGAKIHLTKRIPSQAGLAGGSSDAAATLSGLNTLWDCRLTQADLANLAAQLGSDVPFFLNGPAAICRGRGELVTPVPVLREYHFVLLCPPTGVPTALAFRHLKLSGHRRSLDNCLNAWMAADPQRLGHALFNRLQPVAEQLVPRLTQTRDALKSLGPLLDGHLMSGSGSTYFGLCRNGAVAHAAARKLQTLEQGIVRVVACGP